MQILTAELSMLVPTNLSVSFCGEKDVTFSLAIRSLTTLPNTDFPVFPAPSNTTIFFALKSPLNNNPKAYHIRWIKIGFPFAKA